MLQRTLPAGFIAPCLPTKTDKLPSGSDWLHEIKHDGFRVIVRKKGAQVRLYSRPGNDLTHRFPLIVETLARLRCARAPASSMAKPLPAMTTAWRRLTSFATTAITTMSSYTPST
jgi:ATP dependent DNA ligase domain